MPVRVPPFQAFRERLFRIQRSPGGGMVAQRTPTEYLAIALALTDIITVEGADTSTAERITVISSSGEKHSMRACESGSSGDQSLVAQARTAPFRDFATFLSVEFGAYRSTTHAANSPNWRMSLGGLL